MIRAYTCQDLHQTLDQLTRSTVCQYTYATTQPLLGGIPQQFEVELSLKEDKPENIPFVKGIMDTISKLLQDKEYGLFNLVATPNEDKVKGYFVASPTLTEAVTKNKGKYTLKLFLKHLMADGWASHQKMSLREISRYLSGGSLDSTAKKYYTSWFKAYVYRQVEDQCSRIVDVPHWVMRHVLGADDLPTEIRAIERRVLERLLQDHSTFVTRTKSFNTHTSYHQFIKQHI